MATDARDSTVTTVARWPAFGGVLASRRPTNQVGWTFLAIGLLAGTMALSMEYAHYGLIVRPEPLPLAAHAAWLQTWAWMAMTGAFVYVLLIFPDGRPLSRRWRAVDVLLVASLTGVATVEQLRPVWHIGQRAGASRRRTRSAPARPRTRWRPSRPRRPVPRASRCSLQGVVERRFSRSRYDPTQVVQDFAARLRDQIDPDALVTDLSTTTIAALRPASAAVWWARREGPS